MSRGRFRLPNMYLATVARDTWCRALEAHHESSYSPEGISLLPDVIWQSTPNSFARFSTPRRRCRPHFRAVELSAGMLIDCGSRANLAICYSLFAGARRGSIRG